MKNPRKYGVSPYRVAVVHGGPGAPGEMATVARELASLTGVLEPLQTKDTVAGQAQELQTLLEENGAIPMVLIGHSWGAWLSFILTARCPEMVRKLILVSSAAFEAEYATNIVVDRLNRLSEEERIEALNLVETLNDPAALDKDRLMAHLGELFTQADTYEAIPHKDKTLKFSHDINKKVWEQAAALRDTGQLLALGKKIKCPVVAIHGAYDTHLAASVREPLSRVIKDFRFILLEKCGHEPWVERYARDEFYTILGNELK